MDKIIECSQAGVPVELYIRGICCLRPGIPGKTDNVIVKSVVGRWLEHSRIYKFGDGDEAKMFIGSGDLLNRNLERRVEAFIEVTTSDTREQIDVILDAFRHDSEKSRTMLSDGTYVREEPVEGTSCQEALYRYFSTKKVETDSAPAKTNTKTIRQTAEKKEKPAEKRPAAAPLKRVLGRLKKLIR